MKLLVTAATSTELSAVKKWIKSANIKSKLDIDFLCTWVWNYETIFSLEHYLSKNDISTFIWNIWICGYQNNNEIKYPVQVSSIINIHTEKEYICPPFVKLASFGTFISSEVIVDDMPKLSWNKWLLDGKYFFDMESRWTEFIALKHKIPCLMLKVPFDLISTKSRWLFNKQNRIKTIESITELLVNLPYYDYLTKILWWISNQNL